MGLGRGGIFKAKMTGQCKRLKIGRYVVYGDM